ncbi:MAG: sialidase family protein [Frankiaceae bacterium]
MNWQNLTKMQKRLASGALQIALQPGSDAQCVNPTGGGDEGDEADNECAPDNFMAPSGTTASNTAGYFPVGSQQCSETLGNNTKVNQNCQNISDPDLAGRGQAQNETSIAIDPMNPNHILASQNDYRRGDGNCYGAYSLDSGKTWNDTTIPMSFTRGQAFNNSPREYWQSGGDTSVAWDTKGNAYFMCQVFNRGDGVSPNQDQSSAFYLFRSTQNDGASWNFPGRPVFEYNDTAGTGAVLEDKELMTVDNHVRSPFQDRVYVSWTEFAADGTAYIWEAYSSDYGEHFSPRHLVSGDSALCSNTYGIGTPQGRCNENQFSQPFTGPDGALYVTWANFNNSVTGADNRNQMLIAKSTDGGNTFSPPQKVSDYYDLPDCFAYQQSDPGRACVPEKGASRNSVFRATNYPVGVVNPTNPQQVVVTFGSYINRHSNETNGCAPAGFSPFGQDLYTGVKTPGACNNDILVSVSNDGGATFTGTATDPRALQTANPDPGQALSDQWWQWAAFTKNGKLATSYYDRQYGAATSVSSSGPAVPADEATGYSDVSLSSSGDTANWSVVRVTSGSMPPPTQFGGQFFGDYSGLDASTNAYPLWMDTRDPELFLCPTSTSAAPRTCAGTYNTPTGPLLANDENVYTASVGVTSK